MTPVATQDRHILRVREQRVRTQSVWAALRHVCRVEVQTWRCHQRDLAADAASGALIVATVDAGRPLVAVCHGLAALLAARTADAAPLVAGRRITAFTDEEERLGGLADRAPFLLESALRAQGAAVEIAEPWSDHVVVDGGLITGQNPQSSASAARALLDALG